MIVFESVPVQALLLAGQPLYHVHVQPLVQHHDERGSFTEAFQQAWPTNLAPVQWSFVESEVNVFRGMHLHQRHDELFCLVQGHCLLGLYDLRPHSPTQFQSALYELDSHAPATIIFPPGLLHGWYFTTPSMHLQAVSETYDSYGVDDNYGCQWNDPDLQLPWGITDPVLSERADGFSSLRELLATLTTDGFFAKAAWESR